MYSLLIVDDEDLIRSAVSSIIDWGSLGFSTIYQAENGKEALDICRRNKVDLVLTDIAMPFMDGIELSEILVKEFPDIHIVILTGHEDFEYAKQAVDLGVKSYIMKPVGAATLYQKMKEICGKLQIEADQKEYIAQMKVQLYRTMPVMREKFLYMLVCTQHGVSGDVHEKIRALELPLTSSSYMVGVVEPDLSGISSSDNELYVFMTKNIISDIVGTSNCVFDGEHSRVIVIFNTDAIEDDPHRIVYDTLQIIQLTAHETLKISITCALGSMVRGLEELRRSYQEAVTALDSRYSLGSNRVYDIIDLNYREKSFFYPVDRINDLLYSVKFLRQSDIETNMKAIFADLRMEKNLTPANIKMLLAEVVSSLLKELSCQKSVPDSVWNTGFSLYNRLEKMTSLDDAYTMLLGFSVSVSAVLKTLQENSGQSTIRRVKDFIEEKYADESLSLSAAADSASVSTGYLSALFKKETGVNFVEYLTGVRMEKAKNLLKNTDMKAYEVAYKVGFSNPHYFSVTFKKYAGMSPSDYKNMQT